MITALIHQQPPSKPLLCSVGRFCSFWSESANRATTHYWPLAVWWLQVHGTKLRGFTGCPGSGFPARHGISVLLDKKGRATLWYIESFKLDSPTSLGTKLSHGYRKHDGKHLKHCWNLPFCQMLASYQRTPWMKEARAVGVLFIYSSFWPYNYNQSAPAQKMLQIGWLSRLSVQAKKGFNLWNCQRLQVLKNGNGSLMSPWVGASDF